MSEERDEFLRIKEVYRVFTAMREGVENATSENSPPWGDDPQERMVEIMDKAIEAVHDAMMMAECEMKAILDQFHETNAEDGRLIKANGKTKSVIDRYRKDHSEHLEGL